MNHKRTINCVIPSLSITRKKYQPFIFLSPTNAHSMCNVRGCQSQRSRCVLDLCRLKANTHDHWHRNQ